MRRWEPHPEPARNRYMRWRGENVRQRVATPPIVRPARPGPGLAGRVADVWRRDDNVLKWLGQAAAVTALLPSVADWLKDAGVQALWTPPVLDELLFAGVLCPQKRVPTVLVMAGDERTASEALLAVRELGWNPLVLGSEPVAGWEAVPRIDDRHPELWATMPCAAAVAVLPRTACAYMDAWAAWAMGMVAVAWPDSEWPVAPLDDCTVFVGGGELAAALRQAADCATGANRQAARDFAWDVGDPKRAAEHWHRAVS